MAVDKNIHGHRHALSLHHWHATHNNYLRQRCLNQVPEDKGHLYQGVFPIGYSIAGYIPEPSNNYQKIYCPEFEHQAPEDMDHYCLGKNRFAHSIAQHISALPEDFSLFYGFELS